jgi:hypothetical protein
MNMQMNIQCRKTSLILVWLGLIASFPANAAEDIALFYKPGISQLEFAAKEIRTAAEGVGTKVVSSKLDEIGQAANQVRIILTTAGDETTILSSIFGELKTKVPTVSESYVISKQVAGSRTNYLVIGADPSGAMYGGLDVAEAIRQGTVEQLSTVEHKPYIASRGIKFNIPLDLRTPSYSDNSESAQANIPEMWSREFWREFLDSIARNRFNSLSLWSLNPFPSIVKVPEFPDVALDDVYRGEPRWFTGKFSNRATDKFKPKMLQNAEIVKKMTIDEKIAFWRDVMQMAKDRGVDVYWFCWNAYIWTEEGKHGIKRSDPNGEMLRYFKCSVRETVKTYPLLAGIGITSGENVDDLESPSAEAWLRKTYGDGIAEALKEQPGRPFRLIHRLHESNPKEIEREWKDFPAKFEFSYKYAVAHMYGTIKPQFINSLLKNLSSDRRTWLTLRNDDIYSFRWADVQYARDYILNIPEGDKIAGFFMGPDGYTWGREAMSLDPESPRQLVMQKQWISFMLWGRLSYDPKLSDEIFERAVARRFPQVPTGELFESWKASSRIIPAVTRFIWKKYDFQWLPESAGGGNRSFFTIRDFMEGEGMPDGGVMNVREWRERFLAKKPMEGMTPQEAATQLRNDARIALAGVESLRAHGEKDKELRQTIGDIEAMARLGQYYAAKIDAAAELALFDATSEENHKKAAIVNLEAALTAWKQYVAAYVSQYKQPITYSRVHVVDLPKLTDKVTADIELARNWKAGTLNGKAE